MIPPRIERLLRRVELQRLVIDGRLTRPAHWRGPLRRELLGSTATAERERVAVVFNCLADSASRGTLDVALLLRIHSEIGGGGEFRRSGVRLGPPTRPWLACPSASDVPDLTSQALARAGDGVEAPSLAAARLHLELVLIHPFSDANGRVARLASAWVLMRADYRSTLLTAVEQHFSHDPAAYRRAFLHLVETGGRDHEAWLVAALRAMMLNSVAAAWFRRRENRLRRYLSDQGLMGTAQDNTLLAFDLGRSSSGEGVGQLAKREIPWRELRRRMHPPAASELGRQLRRLGEEESDERRAAVASAASRGTESRNASLALSRGG